MAEKGPDVAQNDTRQTFFRALTDVAGGGLRGMLVTAFGSSRRDSTRPSTADAARALGVSQRTVQRWLASEGRQRQRPNAATMRKITMRARRTAGTKSGRARAIAAQRDRLVTQGFRFSVLGVQGPEHGKGYVRQRHVNFDLDNPEHASGFLDAWTDGGDEAAQQYLVDHSEDIYAMDNWVFEDITDVDVSGPYGR